MNYDNNKIINSLSEEEKKQILSKMSKTEYIFGGAALVIAILCFIFGRTLNGAVLIVFAVLFFFLGMKYLNSSEEVRNEIITTRLVNERIKEYRKTIGRLSSDQEASIKFKYDPVYRNNVIQKVHQDVDTKFAKALKEAETTLNNLIDEREKLLKAIAKERWTVFNRHLSYNTVEGKAKIDGTEVLFSDIHDVKVRDDIERVLLIIKKVCKRLSVIVSLNGFDKEIILIGTEVDTKDPEYQEKRVKADMLANMLKEISVMPVPEEAPKIEEDERIIEINEKIDEATLYLDEIRKGPKYEIPDRYLQDFE